jgi:methylamine dehydrogenase heavy chain
MLQRCGRDINDYAGPRRGARAVCGCLLGLAIGASAVAQEVERPAILEVETSDIATLSPTGPHRVFLGGGFGGGIKVIDGDKARLEGQIPAAPGSNFVLDPRNEFVYVAETIFTRLNRGTRQDLLAVYDDQLELVAEIPLPGRLISVPKSQTLEISADGRLAYVFNMEPAASVAVVDLADRRVVSEVETPGCGMVYPWGESGFAALCADGSLATAARQRGRYSLSRSERFFDAENDPVFEESVVDRASGRAWFISFTGLVYPVHLAETPAFDAAWSLHEAAGLPRAPTEPDALAWRPGGGRFAALHRSSGRLFVLMHAGTHWTHKDSGTEIWVFDTNARKRIARFPLGDPGRSIGVTQDDDPLLFVSGEGPGGGLTFLSPATGETLRSLAGVTGSLFAISGS